jgi:hypothetical protein
MSPPAQRWSPTAGRGIAGWRSLDTPTNRAASALPGPVEKIPANSCPPSIGSPHCPNGGCWEAIKARSTTPTYAEYLDEFVFRFNRRRSRSRVLLFYRVLQLAVDHDPVRYRDLIARPKPDETPRKPQGARGHPPTLER